MTNGESIVYPPILEQRKPPLTQIFIAHQSSFLGTEVTGTKHPGQQLGWLFVWVESGQQGLPQTSRAPGGL